ncbi:MAG: hypothetical protein EOO75_21050, partial [Myxococcales bacterium]
MSAPVMPRPTALALALVLIAGQARSQAGSPPASSRPRPEAGEVPPTPDWEVWPHGRLFGDGAERPADGPLRLCSFEAPVCVHGGAAA